MCWNADSLSYAFMMLKKQVSGLQVVQDSFCFMCIYVFACMCMYVYERLVIFSKSLTQNRYIQIHTDTYRYIHIYIRYIHDTYVYIQILVHTTAPLKSNWRDISYHRLHVTFNALPLARLSVSQSVHNRPGRRAFGPFRARAGPGLGASRSAPARRWRRRPGSLRRRCKAGAAT